MPLKLILRGIFGWKGLCELIVDSTNKMLYLIYENFFLLKKNLKTINKRK